MAERSLYPLPCSTVLPERPATGQGNITTLELERYIKTTVANETDGIQTPIVENNVGDFILFYE